MAIRYRITKRINTQAAIKKEQFIMLAVNTGTVDIRDGIIYALPEDKDWGGNGTYIESKKDNNILVTFAVAQSPSGEIE